MSIIPDDVVAQCSRKYNYKKFPWGDICPKNVMKQLFLDFFESITQGATAFSYIESNLLISSLCKA